MNKMNPQVDEFLKKAKKWQAEMEKLRNILLDSQLTEELKWGKPCYTLQGSNVILILPFKDTCALLFTKGALLKDANGTLIQPTENTQAARQFRLTSVEQIEASEPVLKAYIQEAIDVEKSGLKVEFKKSSEFLIPEELQSQFEKLPALKTAFEALTSGRQRAYLLHFSGAKQSKTRESRVEKCIPQILDGIGLNER